MASSLDKMLTEARFMPLADIFIGAIACILIMIIISKKARIDNHETPQADLIFKCIEQPFFPGDKGNLKRLVFSQLHPPPSKNKTIDTKGLENILKKANHASRLSIRVLLQTGFEAKNCIRSTQFIIRKYNKQYDAAKKIDAPKSYFLLDIARGNNEKSVVK